MKQVTKEYSRKVTIVPTIAKSIGISPVNAKLIYPTNNIVKAVKIVDAISAIKYLTINFIINHLYQLHTKIYERK